MPKAEILFGESVNEPEGNFGVYELPFAHFSDDKDDSVNSSELDIKFEGDDSPAGTLFGLGILRMIVNTGRQALMLFNPKDEEKFPDNFKFK